MSLGYITLIALSLLMLFGVTSRIFDRMRMNDRTALLIVGLIFVGGLIPDIPLGNNISVNIGGALIPLGLCIYLFIKAGTTKERIRAIVASLGAGAIVFFAGRLLPAEPATMILDPIIIYGVLAGLTAYVLGRSRRSAFIGGITGVLLGDLVQGIVSRGQGLSTPIRFGGAGAFDAVILSGIIAVIMAEIVGETRERFSKEKTADKYEYEKGEFVQVNKASSLEDNDEYKK